ncbi:MULTISPECIES: NAD-dependent deacylase [unclassified Leeuwenhoekiella]|uniref:SIR2 family NAD-dependent protein deacylase n=1 Tax=unclassified Leeuwenhoekiella TaxID=2615029 RepID=UPI000C38D5D7|nr:MULTISPECIES: NAD-dependent deacylase [unclassified Leeuwenhoekiella]MAW94732.1 NAD-dependent protein deacylase [Leeuwenhoekiella sp.]MAW95507.1 NAD-dependent protein deacylase [Leeuwenhoekiella sp.]MBA82155.1 NAD-dependent protein deacylase [Leeuwenhoekiella sp.]
MRKIIILSGAGISAESGLKTFRDSDGLWEGYNVMEVASPEGWRKNRSLVLDFYNQRRRQLKTVEPNAAHKALVDLEEKFDVHIITQNVDDLHERAGSSQVLHLHGELLKARSSVDEDLILDWYEDICEGDLCKKNSQLRPHIVWFGELVPLLEPAIELTAKADYIIIVGTSMQVYPAASLIHYAKPEAKIYFIDPKPNIASQKNLKVIAEKASTGVPIVVEQMLNS